MKTKYTRNSSGNLVGFFGYFYPDHNSRCVYFCTGYDPEFVDDMPDSEVDAEVSRLLSTTQNQYQVGAMESQHMVMLNDYNSDTFDGVIAVITNLFKSNGWVTFIED